MPAAWSWADRVISSAALRASRLSSWTVRMTGWSGAASLMSRASLSAFSSSGRTLMRVLIFSEKTRLHLAASRAAVWLASSCWAVEQRAYPIRIGRAAFSARGAVLARGPGFHGRPGPRSPGTSTSSSSRSAGTRTKRAVWYFTAVLPPRVRHGLPAGAWHWGQSWRSAASAARCRCPKFPARATSAFVGECRGARTSGWPVVVCATVRSFLRSCARLLLRITCGSGLPATTADVAGAPSARSA